MHTKETKAHTHGNKTPECKSGGKNGENHSRCSETVDQAVGRKKKKEKHAMYNEVLTRARHVKSLAAGLLLSHRLLGSRKGQKKYTMKGNDEKRNCSSAYTFYSDGGGNKMAVSWLRILYTMPCSRLLYTTVCFNLPRATDSACPRN